MKVSRSLCRHSRRGSQQLLRFSPQPKPCKLLTLHVSPGLRGSMNLQVQRLWRWCCPCSDQEVCLQLRVQLLTGAEFVHFSLMLLTVTWLLFLMTIMTNKYMLSFLKRYY